MKEVLDDIERWRAAGHRVAVARVVALEGSAPRDPGATMAVSDDGEVAGSVSGGCVEGAVVSASLEVLAGTREAGRDHLRVFRRRGVRGRPHLWRHHPPLPRTPRLVNSHGILARSSNIRSDGWATPKSSGRRREVSGTERSIYETLRDALRAEELVALATVTAGPHVGAKLLVRRDAPTLGNARRRRPRSGRGA